MMVTTSGYRRQSAQDARDKDDATEHECGRGGRDDVVGVDDDDEKEEEEDICNDGDENEEDEDEDTPYTTEKSPAATGKP